MPPSNEDRRDLSNRGMWLLSLPHMPLGLLHGPAAGILASIYVSHFGLELAAVGTATFIVRLFDAFTDPMIGYFSDRTDTRWGKRKPYVLAGMLIVCLAVYFVYMPSHNPSISYFVGWFLLLYLGWTIMEIPWGAWAVEVAESSPGRMRVFMCRWVLSSSGWILMFAIPFLPVFSTTQITPETLRWAGWLALVTLPVFTVLAVFFIPAGHDKSTQVQGELLPFLKAAVHNGPFLIFFAAAVLFYLGNGIYFALPFLYVTQVLGLAEGFAVIGLVSTIAQMFAFYFWTMLSDRIGHFRMCAISTFCFALFLLPLAFVPTGSQYFAVTLILICGTQISAGGWYVGMGPLVADAADYDLLKTGINRIGKYYAFHTFVYKASAGVGASIAFILLGMFGYDAAVGAENSAFAIGGFKLTMMAIPVVMGCLAGLVILKFPITAHRHDIIRQRINTRAKRLETTIGATVPNGAG